MTAPITSTPPSNALRSRKLDIRKPFKVVRWHEIEGEFSVDDINLGFSSSLGVEKGEDEEHHLQAALISKITIPTPDASGLSDLPNYSKYYTGGWELPSVYIAFSQMVEEVIGCLYNMTSNDVEFVEHVLMEDEDDDPTIPETEYQQEFEKTMFLLDQFGTEKGPIEKGISETPVTLEDSLAMIEKSDEADKPTLDLKALKSTFEYWAKKRYSCENDGKPILPLLKVLQITLTKKAEEMSTNPDNDPYVCFRRREVKISRKVRRSDTLALDKMRKLTEDMIRVKDMFILISGREKARIESIKLGFVVHEQRVMMRRLKRFLGVNTADTLDASPERTRNRTRTLENIKLSYQSVRDANNLMTEIDANLMDERVVTSDQRIEEQIRKEKLIRERSSWLDCTEVFFLPLIVKFPFQTDTKLLWGAYLGIESGMHISSRRRVGRGGRILFDRHLALSKPSVDYRLTDPIDSQPDVFGTVSKYLYRSVLDIPKDMNMLNNTENPMSNFNPLLAPAPHIAAEEAAAYQAFQQSKHGTPAQPQKARRAQKNSDKAANSLAVQTFKPMKPAAPLTPLEMRQSKVSDMLKSAQSVAQQKYANAGIAIDYHRSPLAYSSPSNPQFQQQQPYIGSPLNIQQSQGQQQIMPNRFQQVLMPANQQHYYQQQQYQQFNPNMNPGNFNPNMRPNARPNFRPNMQFAPQRFINSNGSLNLMANGTIKMRRPPPNPAENLEGGNEESSIPLEDIEMAVDIESAVVENDGDQVLA